MSDPLRIRKGAVVSCNGRRYRVEYAISNTKIQAREIDTGERAELNIDDLTPPEDHRPVTEPLDLNEPQQAEARRRFAFVKKLLAMPRRKRKDVERLAREAGIAVRTMYNWTRRYVVSRRVSSLVPRKPDGGKGMSRLPNEVEEIVRATIKDQYLTRSRKSITATYEEIRRRCRASELPSPGYKTVWNRIMAIPEETRLKARGYGDIVKKRFAARPGTFTDASDPLAIFELDHTILDITLVDEVAREPIGRPYITAIIDVNTRVIPGYYISLDPTSRFSTSLALAHAILPKDTWLERLGVKAEWPFRGRPKVLIVDNAREFDCPWLREACEDLGIEIDYRPVKTPHFGAHIERFFGSLEKAIHELPGTTFSNPTDRAGYDSDGKACMTISELEVWIAEWIGNVYHQRYHHGILMSPMKAWNDGILGTGERRGIGLPDLEPDEELLRIHLLPSEKKTVQQTGIKLHGIRYYSPALKHYIGQENSDGTKPQFIVRFDPRDLGTIYFWDPQLEQYFELVYRTPHPPVSYWEYVRYRRELKAQGLKDIDEAAIFAAKERNEQRVADSVARTRAARRVEERKQHAVKEIPFTRPQLPETTAATPSFFPAQNPVQPYEVDQGW